MMCYYLNVHFQGQMVNSYSLLLLTLPSIQLYCAAGNWPPSKGGPIFPYTQLVSSILIFLGSVIHPSRQGPPIVFLVFLLFLCCGISY